MVFMRSSREEVPQPEPRSRESDDSLEMLSPWSLLLLHASLHNTAVCFLKASRKICQESLGIGPTLENLPFVNVKFTS